jgi:hypothetical protein
MSIFLRAVAGVISRESSDFDLISGLSADADDTQIDPGPAVATITISRDGTIDADPGATGVAWIGSALQTATVGDNFEMSLTKTLGADPDAGLNLDQFYDIDQNRAFVWTQGSIGTKSFTGTMTVREKARTSNSITISIQASADVEEA